MPRKQDVSALHLGRAMRSSTTRKRAACGSLRELLQANQLEVPKFRGELSRADFAAQRQRLENCTLSPSDTQKLRDIIDLYEVPHLFVGC